MSDYSGTAKYNPDKPRPTQAEKVALQNAASAGADPCQCAGCGQIFPKNTMHKTDVGYLHEECYIKLGYDKPGPKKKPNVLDLSPKPLNRDEEGDPQQCAGCGDIFGQKKMTRVDIGFLCPACYTRMGYDRPGPNKLPNVP